MRQQAGGRARAHHCARAATLHHLHRPTVQHALQGGIHQSFQKQQTDKRDFATAERWPGGHSHRDASTAE